MGGCNIAANAGTPAGTPSGAGSGVDLEMHLNVICYETKKIK